MSGMWFWISLFPFYSSVLPLFGSPSLLFPSPFFFRPSTFSLSPFLFSLFLFSLFRFLRYSSSVFLFLPSFNLPSHEPAAVWEASQAASETVNKQSFRILSSKSVLDKTEADFFVLSLFFENFLKWKDFPADTIDKTILSGTDRPKAD